MASKSWSCATCTYVNQPSSKICEMCQAIGRNTSCEWKCPSCTFVNAASAQRCLICTSPISQPNNDENISNKSSKTKVNYIPSQIKCHSIKKCAALERIIKVLNFYAMIVNVNSDDDMIKNSILEYFDNYKDLINDYHHILMVHLNSKTKHENNRNFQSIYSRIIQFIKCDITQCKQYINNNRNRERPKKQINDKKWLFYMDWLDSIHCYLMHSFDVGFRIKTSDLYHNKKDVEETKFDPNAYNDNDNNDDINTETVYHDYEMERIKLHLSNKRKKLQQIRGTERVQHSKFNTDITTENEKKGADDKTNDDKCDDDKSNDDTKDDTKDEGAEEVKLIGYFFGNRFLYWSFYRDNDSINKWYISKKYENLKDELINNKIYNLEQDQYIEAYQKAQSLLNDSFYVRNMKSIGIHWYNIKDNMPLDIQHILSIIVYTDYDTLSYNFSKTYRKTSPSETNESLKNRNSEYWNWGKLLVETVECYGTALHSSNISIFYHGTSMLYFDSFVTKFCCPTSTTPQFQVAAIFAKINGIILELEKYAFGFDLRYFNCSLFSCYGNEDERLFAGGYKELQLRSIRTIASNQNFKYFINSLRLFDKFINGKKLTPEEISVIKKRDYKIIDELIEEELNNECKSKHPVYIKKCFKQFIYKTKQIQINIVQLHQSYNGYLKLFGEKQYHNLISIDKLACLFRNCTDIILLLTEDEGVRYNKKYAIIDEGYIEFIFTMLKEMNQNALLKLKTVEIVKFDDENSTVIRQTTFVNDTGNDRLKHGWRLRFTRKDRLKFTALV